MVYYETRENEDGVWEDNDATITFALIFYILTSQIKLLRPLKQIPKLDFSAEV